MEGKTLNTYCICCFSLLPGSFSLAPRSGRERARGERGGEMRAAVSAQQRRGERAAQGLGGRRRESAARERSSARHVVRRSTSRGRARGERGGEMRARGSERTATQGRARRFFSFYTRRKNLEKKNRISPTGTRTPVVRVKAEYPDQLDYRGVRMTAVHHLNH